MRLRFTDKNKLLTKNNANLLSHPQDKMLDLKIGEKMGSLSNINFFYFKEMKFIVSIMKKQHKTSSD